MSIGNYITPFFLFFILLVPVVGAGQTVGLVSANNEVTLSITGGRGITLAVENLAEYNVSINYSVIYSNIYNRELGRTEGYKMIGGGYTWSVCMITYLPLFMKLSATLEADGQIVEKKGFTLFTFVIVW